MAIGVERRAKKVNTRLDHALLLQPVSNAMAFDPLAQPTGTSFPVPETPTLQSSEGDTEYNTASSGQAVEPTSQRQGGKKRRPSKDKSSSALRRSSSTPHMRNLALGTAGDLSPTGDKRRNKLGYHRTSVACGKPCVTPACGALADFTETGHCRRRKIRCLVANDETTGRCANCIRLKKECNFYPVDQNPEPPRQGAGKDSVAGPSGSSATSSPRHPPSASGDRTEDFRPPYSNAVPGNATARYAVPGESEASPQHGQPTHGCKYDSWT
jgi:hypothetical protein